MRRIEAGISYKAEHKNKKESYGRIVFRPKESYGADSVPPEGIVGADFVPPEGIVGADSVPPEGIVGADSVPPLRKNNNSIFYYRSNLPPIFADYSQYIAKSFDIPFRFG